MSFFAMVGVMESIGRSGKDSSTSHLPFWELRARLSKHTRIHTREPAKDLLSGVGCWRC